MRHVMTWRSCLMSGQSVIRSWMVICIILLLPFNSNGQHNTLIEIRNLCRSISLDSCLTILQNNQATSKDGKWLYFEATIYFDAEQYQKALDLYTRYLDQTDTSSDSLLATIANNQGVCADEINKYRLANQYYLKAIDHARRCSDSLDLLSEIYTNLGILHTKTRNLELAYFYQEKVLEIDENMVPTNEIWIESDQYNLARTLRLLGHHQAEIEMLNQVLSKRMMRQAEPSSISNVLINLAVAYRQLGLSTHALQYIDQALIYDSKVDDNMSLLYNDFYNQCLVYLQTKNGAQALDAALKLELYSTAGPTESLGQIAVIKARAYEILGQKDSSFYQYQRAQNFWLENLSEHSVGVLDQFLETTYYYGRFLYKIDPERTIAMIRNAFEIIRFSCYSGDNLEAYERIFDDHYELTHFATKSLHEQFQKTGKQQYLIGLLHLIEENHQAVVNKNFLRYQVHSPSVPNTLQRISKRILDLRSRLAYFNDITTTTNIDTLRKLNLELNDLSLEWHQKISRVSLENHITNRAGFKSKIAQLQTWCGLHQGSILSYFLTDSSLYINLIREDTIIATRSPILRDKITTLVNKMTSSILSFDDLQLEEEKIIRDQTAIFSKSSHELYEILINPIEAWLRKHLVLIPNGVLFDLPFASLTQAHLQVDEWDAKNFLISAHDISYNYCLEMVGRTSPVKDHQPTIIVAPFKDLTTANEKYYLPGSQEEVQYLEKVQEVRYLKPSTNKEDILDLFTKNSIIHIATHARSETVHPSGYYLCINAFPESFYGRLYLDEIYQLDMYSELVFLNACQTSKSTEGAVSLSRAFYLAGAKHVISTLWQIPDQTSMHFTKSFYEQLDRIHHVGGSIGQAQRAYLNDHQGIELHPYYWDGFVVWGNGHVVLSKAPIPGTLVLALAGLVILSLGTIGWRTTNKKRVVQ